MKAVVIYISLSLLFLFSCNKQAPKRSQQEQTMQEQARQQAIQDSIAKAQAKREAQLAAQRERDRMSKQKNDSSNTPAPATEISSPGTFTSSGDYALQVSSWRSQWKAQKELKMWKERGFSHAYIMKFGNDSTGNVWFRVRLGHLQNHANGEQIGKEIANKYGVGFWITYVG